MVLGLEDTHMQMNDAVPLLHNIYKNWFKMDQRTIYKYSNYKT